MQGAQKLRSEAYLRVRCNDEVESQRRRWTFYETIKTYRSCDSSVERMLALRVISESGALYAILLLTQMGAFDTFSS
jgi:hypothetical protein